ncbi:hypothetical protein KMT30_06750 [Streptomyces sp. IBSBF 2953]|nr:hypothetical protein [Streptomyces hayashii]
MAADSRVFPWAASLDADQLAAFIEDLWGAASGDDDLATLDAIEKAVAKHSPLADHPVVRERTRCPLTKGQVSLLTELANGETRESAARNLEVSVDTLRSRCAALYSRLNVHTAAQAVAIAVSHGWLPDFRIPDCATLAPRRPVNKWREAHAEAVAAMRAQPGTPVEVGPYTTRQGARGAVWRIRQGLTQEYRPAGQFDAEAHRRGSGAWSSWIVSARYLGEPATHTTTVLERTAP